MQTLFRVLNIAFGPILTLLFSARFAGVKIGGRDAGDIIGGCVAGLLILAIELGLTQGPKHSKLLRRWLDPRAAFEGIWLQDVVEGQAGNQVGVFSVDYDREGGTFSVSGHAYSADGQQWAKWNSTHMFIDAAHLKATYLWDGEVLRMPTPETDKSGLTELQLRRPPVFSLPMTGDGSVSHVGERTRLKFRLQRVTNTLLEELGLPFTERDLQFNTHNEESRLAAASLRKPVEDKGRAADDRALSNPAHHGESGRQP